MRKILTHGLKFLAWGRPRAKNGALVHARTLLLHKWCSRAGENTISIMKEALEGALRGRGDAQGLTMALSCRRERYFFTKVALSPARERHC
jgi:hypothetical protein